MNQDQVREKLLMLESTADDFRVIFSGKTSKKVDGLYYPDRKEIIIHNKNFTDDSQLMYTAIHEFAHHLQHVSSAEAVSTRAHTIRFWDIFHRLLFSAEQKGIYVNIFKKNEQFIGLTRRIRENYLLSNGRLMKELGALLADAFELCNKHNASFDDYVDRELLLHRTTAKLLIKIHSFNIRPDIGYDNMKTVATIRDDAQRAHAEEAFGEGNTSDMVKADFISRNMPDETIELLVRERERVERSIELLTRKLAKIEKKISEMKHDSRNKR